MSSTVTLKNPGVEVTFRNDELSVDHMAAAVARRLQMLLIEAKKCGYVVAVDQRINPLTPRDAVTVATVRKARGNY